MKKDEIIKAYDSLRLPTEEDRRILQNVLEGKKRKTVMPHLAPLAAAAAALAVLFMIPGVRVYASELIGRLHYMIFSDSGESLQVEMEEKEVKHYISLPDSFNTIQEAEEAFGTDLLDTQDPTCFRSGKLIRYDPILVYDSTNHDHVAGMMFQDLAYVTGDLKDFRLAGKTPDSPSVMQEFRYEAGEIYSSPIGMQIRVITDAARAEEAGLGIIDVNVQDPMHMTENEQTEIYHIEGIDTDAIITVTVNVSAVGMGPALWEAPNPQIDRIVEAVFSCDGIEYTYFGDVPVAEMKAFLETLR